MSLRRSLYESYKSVHTRLCGVKTSSDFEQTGTLTPREFVEAGDELVLKVPVWQWVSSATTRQAYLPADKQCLVYRGAVCAARARGDDAVATAAHTARPGASSLSANTMTTTRSGAGTTHEGNNNNNSDATVTNANVTLHSDEDVDGFVTIHDTRNATLRHVAHLSSSDDDEAAAEQPQQQQQPQQQAVLTWDADASDKQSGSRSSSSSSRANEHDDGDTHVRNARRRHGDNNNNNGDDSDMVVGWSSSDDDDSDDDERAPRTRAQPRNNNNNNNSKSSNPTTTTTTTRASGSVDHRAMHLRYYDVYITYDAYYRTPRLYLVGYARNRITPLTVAQMKEDVYHSNYDKTVTMDAHPVLGIACISIHPCRHAETMRRLMARMRSRRVMAARNVDETATTTTTATATAATTAAAATTYSHRMALFLFLKFISTVVPHIAYDVSAAVDL